MRQARSFIFDGGILSVGNRQVAGVDDIWKVLQTG